MEGEQRLTNWGLTRRAGHNVGFTPRSPAGIDCSVRFFIHSARIRNYPCVLSHSAVIPVCVAKVLDRCRSRLLLLIAVRIA